MAARGKFEKQNKQKHNGQYSSQAKDYIDFKPLRQFYTNTNWQFGSKPF